MSEIKPDEGAHRSGILIDAPKAARLLAWRFAAVAGANRIDKDKISHIEPSVRIVDEFLWWREKPPINLGRYYSWPESAHVQKCRRGSRASVEHEGERTLL